MTDIEALIPHRDKMKLIEDVVTINEEVAVTTCRAADGWPLHRDGYVDPVVLIEIVAQTAAVHISGRKKSGPGVDRRGWMVGIKNADFFRERIPVGTVLTTSVKNLYQIDHYNVLEGEVRDGSDLLCRVQIQVLRETDGETTLSERS